MRIVGKPAAVEWLCVVLCLVAGIDPLLTGDRFTAGLAFGAGGVMLAVNGLAWWRYR